MTSTLGDQLTKDTNTPADQAQLLKRMNELYVDNGSEYSIVIIKDDKHHKYKKNPKRLRTGKDNVKRSISPNINVNQRLNNA